MKAQVIETFGDPFVFKTAELPKPPVLPGHVLIRVAASSVNPVDCKIRSGFLSGIAPAFPAVLQGDVSGVIEEIGEGVTGFNPGDEVYACAGGVKATPGGALADYLVADAAIVSRKPSSLSMKEAAAVPLVGITAWIALFDKAKIHPSQNVLIHAAAGGVGHIAIQLAKWAGATVYATGSSGEKLKIAKEMGADFAINYREQSVQDYVKAHTGGKGFDVVFDTVGGENLIRSFEAAAIDGTVVSISTRATHDLSLMHAKGLTLHAVFMLIPILHKMDSSQHGKILSELTKLIDEGKIRPLLDPASFTFEDADKAHQHLESGKAIGKVTMVNNRF